MITKCQTSISKFEEFFATSYKDDVFEILEQYPIKRSLIVNYPTLKIYDPDLADLLSECGGRSFRLLQEESEYVNTQLIITGSKDTSRKLIVVFEDDLTSWDNYNIGQHIRFTGILKTYREEKNGRFNFYLYCNHIERLSEELFIEEEDEEIEKEYGVRDSPEYNAWRLEVVSRDKVCQCCGSEKYPVAHHVFSYENYPKLRVDPNNGIRLCKWCHGKYHSHYGITNANPKTYT